MGHVNLCQTNDVVNLKLTIECESYIIVALCLEGDSLVHPVRRTNGLCAFCLTIGESGYRVAPSLAIGRNVYFCIVRVTICTLDIEGQLLTSRSVQFRSDELVVSRSKATLCASLQENLVGARIVAVVAIDTTFCNRTCGIGRCTAGVVKVGCPCAGGQHIARECQCEGLLCAVLIKINNCQIAREISQCGSWQCDIQCLRCTLGNHKTLSGNLGHVGRCKAFGQVDALNSQRSGTCVGNLKVPGRILAHQAVGLCTCDAAGSGALGCAEHEYGFVGGHTSVTIGRRCGTSDILLDKEILPTRRVGDIEGYLYSIRCTSCKIFGNINACFVEIGLGAAWIACICQGQSIVLGSACDEVHITGVAQQYLQGYAQCSIGLLLKVGCRTLSAGLSFHVHHRDNRKCLLGNDIDNCCSEVVQVNILCTDSDTLLFRKCQCDFFPVFLTFDGCIAFRLCETLNQVTACGAGSINLVNLNE